MTHSSFINQLSLVARSSLALRFVVTVLLSIACSRIVILMSSSCLDSECNLCSLSQVSSPTALISVALLSSSVTAALVDPASHLLDTVGLCVCVLRFPTPGAAPSLSTFARNALINLCQCIPQGAPVAVRLALTSALTMTNSVACSLSWRFDHDRAAGGGVKFTLCVSS